MLSWLTSRVHFEHDSLLYVCLIPEHSYTLEKNENIRIAHPPSHIVDV